MTAPLRVFPFGHASCWMNIEMISGKQLIHGSSTIIHPSIIMIAGSPGPCTIHLSTMSTGYCCGARFRNGLSNSSWTFLDSNRRIVVFFLPWLDGGSCIFWRIVQTKCEAEKSSTSHQFISILDPLEYLQMVFELF